MSKSTAPPRDTVRDVWERDEGACARCGRSLSYEGRGMYWSLHHRTPRGSGGTKATWINLPSNLLLMCGSGVTGCHGHIESNRRQAEDDGFIVRHGIRLPADIPVKHFIYGLSYMTDHGTVSTRPPGDRL
jgi:hypothetical protein